MAQPLAHPRARRPLRAVLVATTALALATVLGPGGASAAVSLGPLTKVSGGDPFAGCTADKVASQPGTDFPNAEVEPWIAAAPSDPDRLIAVWQQDRWSNGGAQGAVAGVSTDGGATWRRSVAREITLCTGGVWQRASDVWVDFGPTGTAFLLDLVFDGEFGGGGGGGADGILVSRST